VTTEAESQAFLAEIATLHADRAHVGLTPLLISAWKHLRG
jgi:hypothetical protein